jgi:hypothetical protein
MHENIVRMHTASYKEEKKTLLVLIGKEVGQLIKAD